MLHELCTSESDDDEDEDYIEDSIDDEEEEYDCENEDFDCDEDVCEYEDCTKSEEECNEGDFSEEKQYVKSCDEDIDYDGDDSDCEVTTEYILCMFSLLRLLVLYFTYRTKKIMRL